jgi:hypothetical protein
MEQAERAEHKRLTSHAQAELAAAEAAYAQARAAVDEVTHHGCLLREYFLAHVHEPSPLRTRTHKQQREHRQMDLNRLVATINTKLTRTRSLSVRAQLLQRLWLVEHASPHIPLKAQIGFDPDSM